ncbi:hypothetical protein LSCM4_00655 [Leishmania orientalis]|uniref:Uncharacterized protein n=1 Tax=Leishmania orientalis TaxID=2249476 RepID=A0A836KAN0_9TRYP|nr:hypothetical protein LSCM4_00655 [Leishmania orientalis]
MTDPRLWHDSTTEAPSAGLRRSFLFSNGERVRNTVGCTARSIRCGVARQPPTPISRRPSQGTLIQRTLSSSLILSSDTASASLDVHPIDTTAAVEMSVSLPLWGGASTSPSQKGRGEVPSLTTVSSEWRTSLDFAQQLDIKAEKELQALWSALWSATHSEAMLQTALESRQTQWNPYRPVRGGPEVKAEILRSEVAEFQAMVPRDSLYVRGIAVLPPTSSPVDSVSPLDSSVRARNSWDLPILSRGSGEQRSMATGKADPAEEVFVMDGPSAVAFQSQSTPATSHTRDFTEAELHNASWWAVRRAESEAALFYYVWEAVVVPYYASMPVAFFVASRHSDRAATPTSGSLMPFVPLRAARDDRDASGLVTAFGTAREEDQKWSYEACRRSSSLPLAIVSSVQKCDPFCGGGAQLPLVATARAQRRDSGGVSRVVASGDFDVVSDDSLEVEVLGNRSSSSGLRQRSLPSSEEGYDQNGVTLYSAETTPERNDQGGQRLSIAPVHGLTSTGAEVLVVDTAPHGSTDAATFSTRQRAVLGHCEGVSIPGTTSVSRGGTTAGTSTSVRGTLFGKAASRRQVPLFSSSTKVLENVQRTASPPPQRASAHPRLPRVQQLTTEGRHAGSPAVAVAVEDDHRPPLRVHPATGTSKTRGSRATTSTARGKASPAARSASHTDRAAMSPTTGTTTSPQHALQLLDLHSRSTLRSPMRQRNPSPISNAARETGRQKAMTAESGPPELCAPRPQRCGILSPVQLPLRGKRWQTTGEPKKRVESEMDAQVFFGASEKMQPSSRLGPLREAGVHSATTERQRPAAPNAVGVKNTSVSPAKRNPSIGTRRPGKTLQRSLSKSNSVPVTQQRPTTAQR